MTPDSQGSFRLFRLFGITVFLHWTWFIAAVFLYQRNAENYATPAWAALEYLGLFLIILMHEFGHSLACRQVGGQADRIILWPLGGIAYVSPPQRPGAILWSIAAGPLVNVLLIPVFYLANTYLVPPEQYGAPWAQVLYTLGLINIVILVFNLLPIYPLDGGQILRSILWFFIGPARSLQIASAIGLLGGVAIIGVAVYLQSIWIGILAFFALSQSWAAWKYSGDLVRFEKIPRRREIACPSCGHHPPEGNYWHCNECQTDFDVFSSGESCPGCGKLYATINCGSCGSGFPASAWRSRL